MVKSILCQQLPLDDVPATKKKVLRWRITNLAHTSLFPSWTSPLSQMASQITYKFTFVTLFLCHVIKSLSWVFVKLTPAIVLQTDAWNLEIGVGKDHLWSIRSETLVSNSCQIVAALNPCSLAIGPESNHRRTARMSPYPCLSDIWCFLKFFPKLQNVFPNIWNWCCSFTGPEFGTTSVVMHHPNCP